MEGFGAIVNNIFLIHGQSVEVNGFIPTTCNDFSISLGNDQANVLLNFCPHFDPAGYDNYISCNSIRNGIWGNEHRHQTFPFQKDSYTTISFRYLEDRIIIRLISGSWFAFPVRFETRAITYVALRNFKLGFLRVD